MTRIERVIANVADIGNDALNYTRERGPMNAVLDMASAALMASVVCVGALACAAVEIPVAVAVVLAEGRRS